MLKLQIVNEIISKVDRISYSCLNSLILVEGFSISEVNVSMGSHEWIKHAYLIEENVKFF